MKVLSEGLPLSVAPAPHEGEGKRRRRLPMLDDLLREQEDLTAVERFAQRHEDKQNPLLEPVYRALLPARAPDRGEQYAFEVDLDACTGCKACVAGCHSLNGLDEGETWRSVGTLRGTESAALRTVTTACHHCVDPACMSGCPVNAYQKDPETGIVRHLDDQCIGCQYCTLTCPYEVPQFNQRLGIVRKCDMCSDRLQEGEAPACVQSCPNGAIKITLVETDAVEQAARAGEFLPTAPDPRHTRPTTRYVSRDGESQAVLPADACAVNPAHNHPPLVLFLVLTQLAVGMYLTQWLFGAQLGADVHGGIALMALLATFAGLAASTFHLGRPLYAFRALLGLGRSWMSREILTFGLFAAAAAMHTAVSLLSSGTLEAAARTLGLPIDPGWALTVRPLTAAVVSAVGVAGVFSSMMLYHVTGRAYWHAVRTTLRFGLTTLLLGTAGSTAAGLVTRLVSTGSLPGGVDEVVRGAAYAWMGLTVVKLGWELLLSHQSRNDSALDRSAALIRGPLQQTQHQRVVCALLGGLALPSLCVLMGAAQSPRFGAVGAAVALSFVLVGELLERRLFFMAMASPRMPGDIP